MGRNVGLDLVGFDFGDAPDSYGTLGVASAWHQVDPNDGLRLGSCEIGRAHV